MKAPAPHAFRGSSTRLIRNLRAEARLLTMAGVILLALGFPTTLVLAALAMEPDGVSPLVAIGIGTPLILAGWTACAYASDRLSRAAKLAEEAQSTAPRQGAA
jgi:hypothetical protein